MSDYSRTTLVGRLGRDPETRTMPDGTKVANLSLATSEKWKDKNSGERREKTEWHRVTVWGPLADVVERYTRKGSRILVEGQNETRKFTDQAGVEKFVTEVVLRGPRALLTLMDPAPGDRRDGESQGPAALPAPASKTTGADLDDDIPF